MKRVEINSKEWKSASAQERYLAVMTQYLVGECPKKSCRGMKDLCYKSHPFLKYHRKFPRKTNDVPYCVDNQTIDGYHPKLYKTKECINGPDCKHMKFCMYLHEDDEDVKDSTREMAYISMENAKTKTVTRIGTDAFPIRIVSTPPTVTGSANLRSDAEKNELREKLRLLHQENQELRDNNEKLSKNLKESQDEIERYQKVMEQIAIKESLKDKSPPLPKPKENQKKKQKQKQNKSVVVAKDSFKTGKEINQIELRWKEFLKSDQNKKEFHELKQGCSDQINELKDKYAFLKDMVEIVKEQQIITFQVEKAIQEFETAPKLFAERSEDLKLSSKRLDEISRELEALDDKLRKSVPSRFARRVSTIGEQEKAELERQVERKLQELNDIETKEHLPVLVNMLEISKWIPTDVIRENVDFVEEVKIFRDRLSDLPMVERLFENFDNEKHEEIMRMFKLQSHILQLNRAKFAGEMSVDRNYSQQSVLRGKAFRAKPNLQNRWVVLKQYPMDTSNIESNQESIRQCFKEIYALSKLNHPNVITLEKYFYDTEKKCMVVQFPYVSHGSLKDYVENKNPSFEVKFELMKQLLNALIYLHSVGIIHRDINWNNVLVGDLGQPIIADFDISKDMKSTMMTTTYGAKGTTGYMAPEIANSSNPQYSEKSDVYALGATMLKLFFHNIDEVLIIECLDNLDVLLPSNLDTNEREAAEIIKYMLSKNPESRPDASELACHAFFSRSVIAYFANDKRFIDKIKQQQMFQEKLKKLKSKFLFGTVLLSVNRENIPDTMLPLFKRMNIDECLKTTRTKFDGEGGVDAGGLSREAFTLLFQQISNPNKSDLFVGQGGSLIPGPDSKNFSNAFGKVLAKMLVQGTKMSCNIHIVVYEFLVGNSKAIDKLFKHEGSLSRLMAYLSQYDEQIASRMRDILIKGVEHVFGDIGAELEDGTPVTENNQKQYVMESIYNVLLANQLHQLKEMRKGITSYPKIAEIVNQMSAMDLKIELEATLDIAPKYLIDRLHFVSHHPNLPLQNNLIEVLKMLDSKNLRLFIMFCTGKMNLENEDKIRVVFAGRKDHLPTSHTCNSQLDLPPYDDIETLKNKLTTAIQSGSGFAFS